MAILPRSPARTDQHAAMMALCDTVAASVALLRELAEVDPELPGRGPGCVRLRQALTLVPGDGLTDLFGQAMALRSLAEGLSAAVLDEATSRGLIAESDPSTRRPLGTKIAAWVDDQARRAGTPVTAAAAAALRNWTLRTQHPRAAELSPLEDALSAGRVSVSVAGRLANDLHLLAASIPTDWWDAAAGALIEHAATGASSAQLASLREILIASYGDEGAFEEQQEEVHRQRNVSAPTKQASGLWTGTYAFDNEGYAVFAAAMDALAAPRTDRAGRTSPAADGEHPARGATGPLDDRTAGQRRADALIEMCRVVASDPTLLGHVRPASAVKAQITVTFDYESLLRQFRRQSGPTSAKPGEDPDIGSGCCGSTHPGSGRWGSTPPVSGFCGDAHPTGCAASKSAPPGQATAASDTADPTGLARGRGYGLDGHGTPSTVRRLACDAHLIPAVLGGESAILELGRAARFASPDQIRYLRLRDKGCSFPGGDRPPSWCEAHHLREWAADLGETNVDELTLLCSRHHADIHRRHLLGELIDGRIRWRLPEHAVAPTPEAWPCAS